MRALLLSAVVVLALCACGDEAPREPRSHGVHDRIPVEFTTRAWTGTHGRTISHYTAAAEAVRPAAGCVNARDRRFPIGAAGRHVRAMLDPMRGEGGPEGWCPGHYRGTVTYFEGFACPASGTCHVPRDFPTRTRVAARFTFDVR